jgi:hypothetical protein
MKVYVRPARAAVRHIRPSHNFAIRKRAGKQRYQPPVTLNHAVIRRRRQVGNCVGEHNLVSDALLTPRQDGLTCQAFSLPFRLGKGTEGRALFAAEAPFEFRPPAFQFSA